MFIEGRYSWPAEDHSPRVNIHVSRKIMHRESIFIHRGRSCITSQYPCITKDHALRVNIHALWKIMHYELICKHIEKISYLAQIIASRADFITRRNSCIARRFHTSQKCMHHEKISCLVENYSSREDFIPHRNLCFTGRYSCPARSHALPEKEIVHPKRNIYPSASTAVFYFDKSKHQEEHQRRRQKKY